jgi:activator of 2-hydroxyglutaryl-CoA dehydratase
VEENDMIVAGCDIGSLTAKAVLMEGGELISSAIVRVKNKPSVSAEQVLQMAKERANLQGDSISYIVSTGYGRAQIPFVDGVESEISCHARGARHLRPSTRMER